jgi:RNA polymerase sigma-70 factor (ECF subfamily)
VGSNSADTTFIGGHHRGFPETTHGIVSRLSDSTSFAAAIERLCIRYWKPVHLYVRIVWAKSVEDAKDLTQAFFLWLMQDEALARYAPARGSFRGFLKVLLRRFVGHQERALARLKRGGGIRILPLDGLESVDAAPSDPRADDPEACFDREWRDTMLRNAFARVRRRLMESGREEQVRLFEEHDLVSEAERPSYAQLAARHGLKATDVRNRLFAAREALREELRAELAELTLGDREVEEEWNVLFGT